MIRRKVAVALMGLILATSLIILKVGAIDPTLGDLSGTDSSDWDGSTSTIFYPSADSYMDDGSPDTNFGSDTSLYVGMEFISTDVQRTAIRFSLSSISTSAYVSSADLSLYTGAFVNPPVTVGAHRVQQSPARDWTEGGVTWNNYTATSSWTSGGGDFNGTATDTISPSNSFTWYNWTVTYDVRDFVQTPSTNYGWILKHPTESGFDNVEFESKEDTNDPRLYVSYIESAYDIVGETGTQGLQAGDDSDSLAFGIKIGELTVSSMTAGDKYEIYFTIGSKDFAMFFVATGASAGILRLYHMVDSTWTLAETHTQGSITSGTRFESSNGNIAAKLTNSDPDSLGVVKLEVKKSRLSELGASGGSVTDIAGYSYSGSSTTPTGPGADGGTERDRCPAGSGYASYTMSAPIPEFPLGVLVLAIPVVAIYLYLRRHPRVGAVVDARDR